MRLECFRFVPVLLLCFVDAILGQSSMTTSGTGSVTGTSLSESATTSSISTTSRSRSTSKSGTSSASSTVSADLPTLSGYSTCVTYCLELSIADANCTSVADVNCFCPSSNFTSELTDCIVPECPNELQTAETLAQSFCGLASTSTSLSFSVTSISSSNATSLALSSFSGSTTATGSRTSSDPSSSTMLSSNAAWGTKMEAWGAFVAVLCVVVSKAVQY
ncbi:uncharacterized protein BT62DRAFT_935126 [Guyanagaster necrorhizus]|uniref:CFEM domain-containing protein n=1 Tax=Guyanagaster necrorhizus TaxID=856835 RepID=A0A9P7VMZ0_9AGAR|nr:uncharacterized protein BT62DRAFT_935126 [Guyanagaster necrorhizus MCA 3950]KAG7443515.1 hypothetical protein BT62DRAFT_935126 [Guyanagaster necrorhizus MCA 3950]